MSRAEAMLARKEAARRRAERAREEAIASRAASENAVSNAIYDNLVPFMNPATASSLTTAADWVLPGVGSAITAEDSLDILRDAETPLDYAMAAGMGGLAAAEMVPILGKAIGKGGRAALKGGMKGAGDDVLAFMADMEGAVPPKLRDDPFGFQGTKMDRPNVEIDVRGEQVMDLLPRQAATIEDLQNTAVLPIFGDRTSTGRLITGIDEMDFDAPVMTEGGVDFMRGAAHQADDAVWASDRKIMTRLSNRVRDVAEETGLPVTGSHVTMKPDAADFTTFGGATFAEMAKQSPITKKTARAFNREVGIPGFPGIDSPDLRAWMEAATPDQRKKVIRLAEKSPWQQAGLPSPGKMRYATAEDAQRTMFGQRAGLGLVEFGEELPLLTDPSVPHSTYGVQGAGRYIGSMPEVQHIDLWRDFFNDPRVTHKGGKPIGPSNQLYTMKLNLPYQIVDQQLVDEIMGLERLKEAGREIVYDGS